MKILRSSCLILLVFTLLILSIGVSFGEEEPADFLLRDFISGQKKSFKDILTKKLNLLIITETTCYSCIKELKALESIRKKYGDRVSFTVAFTDRRGWSQVENYLNFYKFKLDMFLVDETRIIPRMFFAETVPTMIFLDRKGNELYRKIGFYEGDEKLIASVIDATLKGKRKRVVAEAEPVKSQPKKASIQRTRGCARYRQDS